MADLLHILQKKLDVDAEGASAQLKAYVEFVRDRAAVKGGVEIQDLGRITLSGTALSFEPEDALLSAVNYRYRSLPIMTSTGESLVAETAAVPDEISPVEAAADLAEVKPDIDNVDEDTPEAVVPEAIVPDAVTLESEREQTPKVKPALVPEPDRTPNQPADSGREKRSLSRIFFAIAGIAAVVALVWIIQMNTGPTSEQATTEPAITEYVDNDTPADSLTGIGSEAENETDSATEDLTENAGDPGDAIQTPEVPEPSGAPASPPASILSATSVENSDPPPRVTGVVKPAQNLTDNRSMADFPDAGRVYAVIVGSTLTRQQANVHVSALPALNYPVSVIAYETDNASGYRVGVGLFRTVADAEAVRISLSSDLPNGSWVYRAK
jgi:hypothetical protein